MTSRALGAAISSEVYDDDDGDESPRFSGHGKRIPFQESGVYPSSQLKVPDEEDLNNSGRKRSHSKESIQSAASEATNEQFAETEVIGIVSIDRSGTVLFSNNKAQEIFQYPNLTGGSIHDFVPNNYFGTDKFQELHDVLIKSFFDKPFAGGRMLDPGTILRAKLQSGKLVPLNVGLEAKLDVHTGKPRLVIAYITEAGLIIDQSKVEKMLSRATLVVMQQFISQAILSAVGLAELVHVPPLRYPNHTDDDGLRLATCKDYTFNKLTLDGDQGEQDYKMLLYVISTAITILISVLPLFVNHMNGRSTDEVDVAQHKKSFKRRFRDFANSINDAQEYLSRIEVFRSTDIVTFTTIVCTTNLFLLYELKSLPNEYEIETVKECEQMAEDELNLSISMCALGAVPIVYFTIKSLLLWMMDGCRRPRWCSRRRKVVPQASGGHLSSHSRKTLFAANTKFKSRASMRNFSEPNSARIIEEEEEAPMIELSDYTLPVARNISSIDDDGDDDSRF